MRSITAKLLLAFLAISIISIMLMILIARWTMEREFRSFLFDQNRTDIVSTLTDYYSQHGSWEGVDQIVLASGGSNVPPPDAGATNGSPVSPPHAGATNGRPFFTLVDTGNRVVAAGPGYHAGEILSQSDIAQGIPLEANGEIVGTLVFGRAQFPVKAPEADFLNRVEKIYLIGGVGVVALAALLALLLSRTMTRPIRDLTAATRAVSDGKLEHEVPVRSHDEMGELAASFNRMNAELARSAELRRQMTADIAHELRTPISVIIGHAEGVHDGVLQPSLETFEIIRDEANRLEQLVEDLRTLSRADAGELPIEKQSIEIAELLETMRATHNHTAEQKSISLDVQVAAGLPKVNVDPGRMMQVLHNLVDNALRYTPEGGHILLSARAVEKALEIRVQDSGSGIPEGELEHVFERFYRSDPSRQREQGGSGLGLAIARSIVEKHNGRIWAESKPGEGTTMLIHLPITE